jgi:hypothetical protein
MVQENIILKIYYTLIYVSNSRMMMYLEPVEVQ